MPIQYVQRKIESFFGFKFTDFSTFQNFVDLLYESRHPHNLGIIRILFGMLMMIDVLYERGGLRIMSRWGDPHNCHFPLFPQMRPLDLYSMGIIYGLMWIGALGITLGYKFRYSTLAFIIPYWYILLLDKSYWNNHSYLFGLVSILFLGSSANHIYSIDALLDKCRREKVVPFWNYFILRFQFFMLYFMAGLKKIDMEWLGGHAMVGWGTHWVFEPFKFLLTTEQIDYLIIHWFGFLLDLTIGFWLLSSISRPYAIIFSTAFHLMNSRLFSIGMFPYVCIATTPIFCDDDWPIKIRKKLALPNFETFSGTNGGVYKQDQQKADTLPVKTIWRRRSVTTLLLIHCGLQCFLPYSHFITKGYNNWTNGLYGYSWDMMVHSWNSALTVVRVRDNISGKEYFIRPDAWTKNERWSKHADMCVQYAHCLKENLINLNRSDATPDFPTDLPTLSDNISVYIDVWCSLNGRFQQRMFDPNYDLLKANWSVFKPVEWLLPLLTQSSEFRYTIKTIQNHIYSWSNHSDVLFIADFPGMHLENYLSTDLSNVTLTVLDGEVIYEIENLKKQQSLGYKLSKGSNFQVNTGVFHKIHTTGFKPSLYMYTYINQTHENVNLNM